jgi:hypothetical protein
MVFNATFNNISIISWRSVLFEDISMHIPYIVYIINIYSKHIYSLYTLILVTYNRIAVRQWHVMTIHTLTTDHYEKKR